MNIKTFSTKRPLRFFKLAHSNTNVEPNPDFRERSTYNFGKRLIETSLALAILIGLSPLWAIVCLLIKLTSAGPVLYRGRVIGKNGREFTYYKFRSMCHNNDNAHHRAFIQHYVRSAAAADGSSDETLPQFKLTNDSRVTRIGKFIRKFSIDEVPQLFNVLRGEMAIVGPRPPVPYEYEMYDEWCSQRLQVLPGITGLAQVRGRGQVSFDEMVKIDLEYIADRSLSLDLWIMLKDADGDVEGSLVWLAKQCW